MAVSIVDYTHSHKHINTTQINWIGEEAKSKKSWRYTYTFKNFIRFKKTNPHSYGNSAVFIIIIIQK